MKILVLDNYDSFTYNLVHCIKKFTTTITVVRNDEITLEEVDAYDKILLSPGPGLPDEANLLKPIIQTYANRKSILGVCLGQQAIAEVFGGKLMHTQQVHHGIQSEISVCEKDLLFDHLPDKLLVGRYHSWVVSPTDFPECLQITALGPKGEIMAIRHKNLEVRGVQFHPESILTPKGEKMLQNWIEHTK
ncbi:MULTISPECIES: anthranilate synthase component II [Weeksella]|uniref:Glutamine amidotransferase of anthranilate synthase n=1 Tax=Weeksella virosa (strain ATCC 43766 / DSM 16922 / JCM 21250 / CCUG 30538 / CDC 9751 / IAM 14551 / NBRC 16016 / NCTC 11634 / CL345/78) TaxID=865938 RepID=F0P1L2_WEEVC|nr:MULTISPECIES: aminodeoxychorismate/anthranilate synthase component II [Weeksella]ADX67640.1 glutamine amidotransferase of anthranilate synthase [Weeksella virosa DSM 16922]MDK7375408.1 aminodeoxychorismate/anthranilate synthase component II [Weeksella virosa]MDK7676077.1 aminodeoxychorismate/anthranilate synthase component II [Weeksella virosa]SUP53941.1 Para-aminobenzoate synthase glutamine amidotransferase component II [Weeksella virosa]VEH64735.1 Para-aminobenzoate synthase glutamine ami